MTSRSASEMPGAELERISRDRSELLELQTATSDVLEAIGRSGFELDPIFETVVRHAIHLCRADAGHIFTYERDRYRLAWLSGGSPEYRSELAARNDSSGPRNTRRPRGSRAASGASPGCPRRP